MDQRLFPLTAFTDVIPSRLLWTGLVGAEPRLIGVYRNIFGPTSFDELLCCCFDHDGAFRELLVRPLTFPTRRRPGTKRDPSLHRRKKGALPLVGVYLTADEGLDQLQRWATELGITPKPVNVQQFRLPDHRVSIHADPDEAVILQHDPFYYPTQQERDDARREFAEWRAKKQFLFWWAMADYPLNAEGEVIRYLPDASPR